MSIDGEGRGSAPQGRRKWIAVLASVLVAVVVLAVIGYALLTAPSGPPPRALASVTISGPSGPMVVGDSRAFAATAFDSDAVPIIEATFAWSLVQGLGTLSSTVGNVTTFEAAAEGTETLRVTASYRGATREATRAVTVGPRLRADALSLQAPAAVDTGASFTVALTARDQAGGVFTGYRGTVRFASNDTAATLPPDYTFVATDNGVHAFAGVVFVTLGVRSLSVADPGDPSLAAEVSITVRPAAGNGPPVIGSVNAAQEDPLVGQTIAFSAIAVDPDGDPLTYSWDFGDGVAVGGATPTHAYSLPGRYIAVVTVDDGQGHFVSGDDKLLFLLVLPLPVSAPPAPDLTGPASAILAANRSVVLPGQAVTFSGNASWAYLWDGVSAYGYSTGASDPTLFASLTYDWGDGTPGATGTSSQVGYRAHTFAAPGSFLVNLTVRVDGPTGPESNSAGYTIRVQPVVPSLTKTRSVLVDAWIGEPEYLDPAVDYEDAGGKVLQNVYETLIAYPDGSESVTTLVPRLATEVPTTANGLLSADGLNYTFNLRTGVTFHDGSAMTAANVEYSIERVLAVHDPDGPSWMIEQILTNYVSYYADIDCDLGTPGDQWCTVQDWVDSEFASPADVPAHFRAVLPAPAVWPTTALSTSVAWSVTNSSVEQMSSTAVRVHLTHPYPAFLQIASRTVMSIVSRAAVEAHGGLQWGTRNAWMDRNTIGTGPFKLTAWVPNQRVSLARNDAYYATPPALASVHLLAVRDDATRELMLFAGDADIAHIPRERQYDVMNPDGTPRYPTLAINKDKPTFDVLFFGYNQNINAAGSPDPLQVPATFFSDVHVRKAFSYAFDHAQFIQYVIYDGGEQLRGPIPRGMMGYNASLPLFSHNAAQAQAELQAAMNPGVPGQSYWQTGFFITLYYNAGNTDREQGCLLLKQGLEALGAPGAISVSVRALDQAVYLATLRNLGLPIFVLGWAPDYADPDDYAFPFLHSRGTFPQRVGYSNATIDAMVSAAASELDPVVREQLYKDMQGIVVQQHVPYLWVYQATNFHVERSWVAGYYFNPMLSGGYYYSYSKA